MIEPSEARGIFEKWLSEGTEVSCTSSLYSCWGLALRGRVVELAEDGSVLLTTSDGTASLRLNLSEADGFEYAEPKDAPPEIAAQVPERLREAGTLVVGLPLRVPIPTMPRSKLFFMELPAEFDK